MYKSIFSIFIALMGFSALLNAQIEVVLKTDSLAETKLLKQPKVKKTARRNGDTLFFQYTNGNKDLIFNTKERITRYDKLGKPYTLTVQKENGEIDTVFQTSNYRLTNVYKNGTLLLVKKIETDNGSIDTSYVLRNSITGALTDMLSKPIFSPDGIRFITTQSWGAGDARILGVTITSTSENNFNDEFYISDDKSGYSAVHWETKDKIKILRNDSEGKSMEPLTYQWDGTKWIPAK